jgi:hypothetical protein
MLSEENLRELRQSLAHLSLPAVRDFYERTFQDCRLIYNRIPSPRQMQTLVQVWNCGNGAELLLGEIGAARNSFHGVQVCVKIDQRRIS